MNYLVIDQGGHSSRALVYNESGTCIEQVQYLITSTSRKGGSVVEADPQAILQSIQHCISNINSSVNTAALICQRSNFLACRKSDLNPISPIISWQDTRNADWVNAELERGLLDESQFHRITGLRINAHLGFSKIQWLLHHSDAVKHAAIENDLIFISLSAWLAAMLTNTQNNPLAICDPSCAQRMGLFDIHQNCWSAPLLKHICLSEQQLPNIVDSIHPWGSFNNGTALKLVGGDQSFIPFFSGLELQNNATFVNMGSGAFVMQSMQETGAALADERFLYSAYQLKKSNKLSVFAEATINTAASAINAYFQQFESQLPDNLEKAIHHSFFVANKNIPLYLNASAGLAAPFWYSKICSYFCYGSVEADDEITVSDEFMAVIESVVFLIGINIEALSLLRQSNVSRPIVLSGGLSKSDVIAQLIADVSQRDVWQSLEAETSAKSAVVFLFSADQKRELPIYNPDTFNRISPKSIQQAKPLLNRFEQFKQLVEDFSQ
ncbi:MAG: hypothetical protein KAG18_00065 [Sinobacterium sp.]|nr:hypothetical protein [Sinobacterium sp.]